MLKRLLKVVLWGIAAIVGIFAYFAFPEFKVAVTGGAVAAFVYWLMQELVERAVTTVVRRELDALKTQSYSNTEKIKAIDRRTDSIWQVISQFKSR